MNKDIFKIEKLDHFGRGIVEIDGKKIFVENALIDDEVCISIVKDKKTYSVAKVSKYIKKSPLRRDEICPRSDMCGGCDILELSYRNQLEFKEKKVKEIISRNIDKNIIIKPIIYSDDLNYRNKITLHVKNRSVGLYQKNSNEIIEINHCYLVDDRINKIIERVSDFIKNEKHNLNQITIKVTSLNEVMIVFDGVVDEDLIMKHFGVVSSIFINNKCIKNKYIKEKLGEYEFLLSKESFFQVNRYTTIKLYNKIVEIIKDKNIGKALDLYCGTGTITISVSKYVKNIIGIEEVSDAVESANENKRINNIDNVEFICDKVENKIDSFNNIDLIMVDPPRSGLSNSVVQNIIKINPKQIIYVSCDIMTLVRDLNILKEKYNILEITPVDMFPNTYHCENVCVLERM